jgi:hypothetical protein
MPASSTALTASLCWCGTREVSHTWHALQGYFCTTHAAERVRTLHKARAGTSKT